MPKAEIDKGVRKELLLAAGVKKSDREKLSEGELAYKVLIDINELSEEDWEDLSEEAQNWHSHCADVWNASKVKDKLPPVGALVSLEEDEEEEDEDEEEEDKSVDEEEEEEEEPDEEKAPENDEDEEEDEEEEEAEVDEEDDDSDSDEEEDEDSEDDEEEEETETETEDDEDEEEDEDEMATTKKKGAAKKAATTSKKAAKPAAKKAPAKAAGDAPKGARGRKPNYDPNAKVTVLTDANPHRENSKDYGKFKKIKTGMTVQKILDAGVDSGYIRYALSRELIKIG